MRRILNALLIASGTACVAVGVVGLFVPLLPTTPFLLLAAICYARSSPRLLKRLLDNRWFGASIRNYREGRGVPRRDKIVAIVALWLTIGFSIIFFTRASAAGSLTRFLLIIIALGVTLYLLRIKTFTSALRDDRD